MPKLVIATGSEPMVVPLTEKPITIGREPENDIQVDGPDVSRRHCRIEPGERGGHRLVDLESKNGTFLNGRPVKAMALEFDDRIRLGDALFVYADDATDPIEALERSGDEAALLAAGARVQPSDAPAPEEPSTAARRAQREQKGLTRLASRSYLKERLLRLLVLSQNIASELDLGRLLDTILDEVLDFTGFERGLFLLHDEETGRLKPVLGRNMEHTHLEEEDRRYSRGLVDRAIEERQIVFRTGVKGGAGSFSSRESVVSLGLDSALCIPLFAPVRTTGRPDDRRRARRNRLLGAIYLDSTSSVRSLGEADLQLLEKVAAQAAIALQNARLHQQATTDPLTGLANRGFMKQVLEDEVRRAKEDAEPLGVILIDLDHFKRVNDTYGHGAGDEVLRRVAQRVRRTIRRDDYAARWGGEEFLVLLPGEGVAGVVVVGQKIAEAISSQPMAEAQVTVTASFGVAVFPDHGDSSNVLVKHADQALYAAKAAGRNRIEVFRPELDRADHRADPIAGIFEGETARTHRNIKTVFDTLDVLRSNLPPHEILERALDAVCDLTGARRTMLVVDKGGGELAVTCGRLQGGKPLPPEPPPDFSRTSVRTALAETRSLCLVAAEERAANRPTSASIDRLGLSTVMCVPLVVRGRPLGVLYADDTAATREFSQNDLAHLEVLAHQLALSLAASPELRGAASAHEEPRPETDAEKLRAELARLQAELDRLEGKGPAG